jgi:hypothetical protein
VKGVLAAMTRKGKKQERDFVWKLERERERENLEMTKSLVFASLLFRDEKKIFIKRNQ